MMKKRWPMNVVLTHLTARAAVRRAVLFSCNSVYYFDLEVVFIPIGVALGGIGLFGFGQ